MIDHIRKLEDIETDTNELQADWANGGRLDNILDGRAPSGEYNTQMGYIPSDLGDVPTDSELNSAHGSGSWLTATGFSVPNEYDVVIAALQTDLNNPNQYKADVSNLDVAVSTRAPTNEYDTPMGYIPSDLGDVPTGSELNSDHGSGSWESATVPTVDAIADAVWDEDLTEHTTTNTAGKIMQQIKSVVGAILGLIS